MLFLLFLLLTHLLPHGLGEDGQVWDDSIHDFLVDSTAISYVKKDFVHVGIILCGIRGTSNKKRLIILKLEESRNLDLM